MNRRLWPGVVLGAALVAAPSAAATLTVPAVPYLPQSEALCGGAAMAMVLRYWGLPAVRPEDFAFAVNVEGTGIPAASLPGLIEARGFQAFAFDGGRAEAVSHLEKGRPLIALLSTSPGRHHYVVMLAWANQRVLVHDPAVGPFRVIPEADWQERTQATGRFTLLVLPPDGFVGQAGPAERPSSPEEDACAAPVQAGVDLALGGRPDAARDYLAEVAALCPHSPRPVREMAALEFRRENWTAAALLADAAVRRDPQDRLGWKLLATSRFLAGQREEALRAWNRIDEPRLDLVQINGFDHTPTRVVYQYLGEEPQSLLTPERLRRVQRRIDALPTAQLSRVSYRPLSGGTAQLEVNVVERPAFSSPLSVLLQSGVRAISERAIGADLFAIAPSGDSVRLLGQWQPNRYHAALSVSAPHFLGLPGIVTAEALTDQQSYRISPASPEGPPVRERRDRASLSLAHWWTADTRAAATVAADDWSGRGRFVSLAGDVARRLAGNHVSVGARGAGWWSSGRGPFYAAGVLASGRTSPTPERARLCLDATYTYASARAPLALWSGAGTGSARALLLRAHPLLRDGVIEGAVFGRELLAASLEAEAPIASWGPARMRAALFLDAAKVLAPARGDAAVDIGVGLRLLPPGRKSALRVDIATAWGTVKPRLSVGWQGEWP